MNGATRLWRKRLDFDREPGQALLAIADEPGAFALTGSWAGGGAILGCDPLTVAGPDDDPFDLWDRLPSLEAEAPEGAVGGGWFGWLGYGAGARVENLPPQPPRPYPLPETQLAFHDNVLRLDPAGRWWFEALVTPERDEFLRERCTHLEALLSDGVRGETDGQQPPPDCFRLVGPGADGHLAAVARCRQRIRSGEFFQANLRIRLEAEWEGDLAALFGTAIEQVRPAFGAYFALPDGGIASLSPELFLRRAGERVETGPIKGTAPRSPDPRVAESAREKLAGSGKDAAEHVMIVDVARNDLGRVCEPGTVVAPGEPGIQAHPGLWHLVSTVSGTLRKGTGNTELLRATFPPCSVTGAPKIQAMHVISELEPFGREVFTGAIGFASPAAGMETSVAIRTFEASAGRLWLDVGGGIVADSDPERELEECLAKAEPLIEAIGSRIQAETGSRTKIQASAASGEDSVGSHVREPGRGRTEGIHWVLDHGNRRPDPGAGVIETFAVRAGTPANLDLHLARMEASVKRLYGNALSDGLADEVHEVAARPDVQAIRITARPDGSEMVESRLVLPRRYPIELTPFLLPGGLGAHKWADRRLLDRLAANRTTPLLLDTDGTVLEASWGNVWIVEGERLVTPPADGRILDGITRGDVIRADEWQGLAASEEHFGLDRLASADRILVSSSLAGLVPTVLAHTGEV